MVAMFSSPPSLGPGERKGEYSMTVYAFGLEEHLYSGSGVNQGNTYYYHLKGMLIGEFDGTNTNMFLTDA